MKQTKFPHSSISGRNNKEVQVFLIVRKRNKCNEMVG